MAPPPALMVMDEILEEALFRVPPDDPESLVRAALVCQRWRRIVSKPGFPRRYCEFHRSPPVLGFIHHLLHQPPSGCPAPPASAYWMPTSSFRLRLPAADPSHSCIWEVRDARHGRILLFSITSLEFAVFNPVSGEYRRLPREMSVVGSCSMLLCAAPGCDHLDCPSGGPFTVSLIFKSIGLPRAMVYSSEADSWSPPISVDCQDFDLSKHGVLVGNALYFICKKSLRILKFDLGGNQLSVISPPPTNNKGWASVIPVEDGRFGFAMVQESKLNIWLREAGPNVWTLHRLIALTISIPVSIISASHKVAAFVDGAGVILTWGDDGAIFLIDPKSGQVTKKDGDFHDMVPYSSFCIPGPSSFHDKVVVKWWNSLGAASTSESRAGASDT